VATRYPSDVAPGAPRSALRRFFSFIAVGALGFGVDGAILSLLVHGWDWAPYTARVLSFVPAVTVTWYCNRRWVFVATRHTTHEYGAYFGVQTVGAAINLLTYALAIAIFPTLARLPIVPLAVGSAVALVFNYSAARHWVFGAASRE
jgi:putative flippase GtrA